MIATRVVPKRSIPAPCTRIHCVSNELLRSQLSSYHGGGHEALLWQTRPARGKFRLKNKLSAIWTPFPLLMFTLEGKEIVISLLVSRESLFFVLHSALETRTGEIRQA